MQKFIWYGHAQIGDNIETTLKQTACEDLEWTYVTENRDKKQAFMSTVMNFLARKI